ncbi:MAG: TIM-barrel domain-containing protein [Bacteroidota bacterium]
MQMKNRQTLPKVFLTLIILGLTAACTKNGENQYYHDTPKTMDENVVLPPAWAFGVLYGGYTNQEQTISRIRQIQQRGYPIDAYWIDSWFWSFDDQGEGPDKYIDFVADTLSFPDRRAMWSFMESHTIKGGFWTWDAIQQTGNEAAFEDFQSRGFFRDVYQNTSGWHNKSRSTAMFIEGDSTLATPTGNIDFSNPEAVVYFKQRMKHFFDEGADFIKLDRTARLNVVKAMFEMSHEFGKETQGRGFVLSHSGGVDNPQYKRYPAKWTDDTRSDWTIETPTKSFNPWVPKVAFQENVKRYTDTARASHQIPFLTNDTGGYDIGLGAEIDEELFIRWMQFSVYSPILELFSQPENPTSNLPWKYSERADSLFVTLSHCRMELFPYLYTYAHLSRWEAKNMLRLMEGHHYQYLLGEELLVAPVVEQGASTKSVFLPKGTWVLANTMGYHEGGRTVEVRAPLEQIPVFVRAGAIIPKREYATSIEKGTNDKLTLEIYPGASHSFTLIEDDGTSNEYLKGRYATTELAWREAKTFSELTIYPVKGGFAGMKDRRSYVVKVNTQNYNYATLDSEEVSIARKVNALEVMIHDALKSKKTVVRFRKEL